MLSRAAERIRFSEAQQGLLGASLVVQGRQSETRISRAKHRKLGNAEPRLQALANSSETYVKISLRPCPLSVSDHKGM